MVAKPSSFFVCLPTVLMEKEKPSKMKCFIKSFIFWHHFGLILILYVEKERASHVSAKLKWKQRHSYSGFSQMRDIWEPHNTGLYLCHQWMTSGTWLLGEERILWFWILSIYCNIPRSYSWSGKFPVPLFLFQNV